MKYSIIFIVLSFIYTSIWCQILAPGTIAKCKKSVVNIEVYDAFGIISVGTGFYIAPDMIATNYHVVRGAPSIRFQLENDTSYYSVEDKIFIDSVGNDLAILHTSKMGSPVEFSKTKSSVGDLIFTIGNAGGNQSFSMSNISTIAALYRSIPVETYDENIDCIQINTNINNGNSGGPVFDVSGRVVGMCFSGNDNLIEVGYAIPKEKLKIDKNGYFISLSKSFQFKREIQFNTLDEDFNILYYIINPHSVDKNCGNSKEGKFDRSDCYLKNSDTLSIVVNIHNVGNWPIIGALLKLSFANIGTQYIAKLEVEGENFNKKSFTLPIYIDNSLKKITLSDLGNIIYIKNNIEQQFENRQTGYEIVRKGLHIKQIDSEKLVNGQFRSEKSNFTTGEVIVIEYLIEGQ